MLANFIWFVFVVYVTAWNNVGDRSRSIGFIARRSDFIFFTRKKYRKISLIQLSTSIFSWSSSFSLLLMEYFGIFWHIFHIQWAFFCINYEAFQKSLNPHIEAEIGQFTITQQWLNKREMFPSLILLCVCLDCINNIWMHASKRLTFFVIIWMFAYIIHLKKIHLLSYRICVLWIGNVKRCVNESEHTEPDAWHHKSHVSRLKLICVFSLSTMRIDRLWGFWKICRFFLCKTYAN